MEVVPKVQPICPVVSQSVPPRVVRVESLDRALSQVAKQAKITDELAKKHQMEVADASRHRRRRKIMRKLTVHTERGVSH
eukprot:12027039-Karenia_brevis.AAC.1